MIGYGIRYDAYKNGDTSMSDVAELINDMRSSKNEKHRRVVRVVDDIISFNEKSSLFRFKRNFIAEVSDYAEKSNIKSPDMYFYYALTGLKEIAELEEYAHINSDIECIKAMYELKKAESTFYAVKSFVEGFCDEV